MTVAASPRACRLQTSRLLHRIVGLTLLLRQLEWNANERTGRQLRLLVDGLHAEARGDGERVPVRAHELPAEDRAFA